MNATSISPGNLLIRADASAEIGIGHVMRCLALAQAWRAAGGKATFVMACGIASIEKRLAAENCDVAYISCEGDSLEDANCTEKIARRVEAAWVVLDGYHFGSEYQKRIKNAGFKILYLDDIGSAEWYFADVILNQNIHANEGIYVNRENYTQCLLGPRFVLLRNEFTVANDEPRQIRDVANRVLVMTGGSDSGNVSARVADAIRSVAGELEVVVVSGPGNRDGEKLGQQMSVKHKFRIVKDPDSIVPMMQWADVAVSASGSTVWEMCRVGLPAILVSLAENQVPGARELDRSGIAKYLGPFEQVSGEEIARELHELLLSRERRARMSTLGQQLIDGCGSKRVVATLMGAHLKIRRATEQDCMLLWQWVNDPAVRGASFKSEVISQDEHVAWFAHTLESNTALIYVAEDEHGVPVGQFRVEWEASRDARVDVSVAPCQRGQGIGADLIASAARMAFEDTGLSQLHAYIKPENQASVRVFEKAGFSKFEKIGDSIHCCIERG